MNGSHLPDDARLWPDDPHMLLGVDRTVDRRGLRQAYVRLIRIYRPEHFPAQFRRIREAYEHVEGCLRYQQFFADHASEFATEGQEKGADDSPDAERASEDEATSAPTLASKSAPAARSPVEAAWDLAREGQAAEAYRRLRELERQRPGNQELCLRLYWLLVLHPDLDPGRDRRTWLTAGLSAAGLAGPLMELYERELQGDPLELQRPRCRGLLQQTAPLGQRATFAMRCWAHLGLAGSWELIAQDLESFREQVAAADVATWVRMLLVCEEQFRWQADRKACLPLAKACQREIEEHSEEHQNLMWELDRGDSAEALTAGLRKLVLGVWLPSETSRRLNELLRRGWVLPFAMIREELLAFLRPMVEDPVAALERLDRIYQVSAAVADQLNRQVQTLYYQRHDFSDDEERAETRGAAVSAFFREQKPDVYEKWRLKILLFCLRHGMTFSQFQQAASSLSLLSDLTEQWKTELSLHCLTTACEAFWLADQDGEEVVEVEVG